jgi:hypothetical protein
MMSKPVVIVGVEGGVADYQTIPSNSADVILIDWDNLKEYGEPKKAMEQAKEQRTKVAAVLKRTKAPAMRKYLKGILDDLDGTIESIEVDLKNDEETGL